MRLFINPLICWGCNIIIVDQESHCAICGSNFPSKQCYFCQTKICTSCIVPSDVTGNQTTIKCIRCDQRKVNKISVLSVIKRNKLILGLLAAFWIYTVFPLPFLQAFGIKTNPTSFQPIIIATAVMTMSSCYLLGRKGRQQPINLQLLNSCHNKEQGYTA